MGSTVATLRNGRTCGVNGTIDPDAEPDRELDHACDDPTSELPALSISDGADSEAVLATDVIITRQASLSSEGNDIVTLEDFKLSLLRTPVSNMTKKLLILDLNGLLVDVVTRPPKDFKADIRIGRQAKRSSVATVSSQLHPHLDVQSPKLTLDIVTEISMYCILSDMSECTTTRFNTLENKFKPLVFKELKRIWEKEHPELPWERGYYTESNTLLLDDSPYKALLNPAYTAIFPFPYQFTDKNDNSLGKGGDIRVYLEELAGAENVQIFVEQNPFGQKAITEKSVSWSFYSQVLNSFPKVELTLL